MPSLIELPTTSTLALDDLMWLADMSQSPGDRDRNAYLADLVAFIVDRIGGVIPLGDTASRPTEPDADFARLYFDTDLGKVIVNDGADWLNLDGSSL